MPRHQQALCFSVVRWFFLRGVHISSPKSWRPFSVVALKTQAKTTKLTTPAVQIFPISSALGTLCTYNFSLQICPPPIFLRPGGHVSPVYPQATPMLHCLLAAAGSLYQPTTKLSGYLRLLEQLQHCALFAHFHFLSLDYPALLLLSPASCLDLQSYQWRGHGEGWVRTLTALQGYSTDSGVCAKRWENCWVDNSRTDTNRKRCSLACKNVPKCTSLKNNKCYQLSSGDAVIRSSYWAPPPRLHTNQSFWRLMW